MKHHLRNTTIIRSPLLHIYLENVGSSTKKNYCNILKNGKSSSARAILYINFEEESKTSEKRIRQTINYIIEHVITTYRLNDTEGMPQNIYP